MLSAWLEKRDFLVYGHDILLCIGHIWVLSQEDYIAQLEQAR